MLQFLKLLVMQLGRVCPFPYCEGFVQKYSGPLSCTVGKVFPFKYPRFSMAIVTVTTHLNCSMATQETYQHVTCNESNGVIIISK